MSERLPLPSDYSAFLRSVKQQVQYAQLRAVLAVNKQLITLYWNIGQQILKRQEEQGWGSGVVEQLSSDLHAAFPEMKGFSPRNLKYMRAFAKAYPDEQFVQTVSAQITWSHNVILIDKVKNPEERLWYMRKAAEHGWSHSILDMQIKTGLHGRSGRALTNFNGTLPAIDSDLAQNALNDPYVFDFITTSSETKERNIQEALISHIERFLLELGVGFTFVGSNHHLVVGGQDYYLDMLLYHVHLRRYVVIELKAGAFKPEYAGKLNFYVTAVNEQVKRPEDNSTIGIILCKGKNKVVAEYALSAIDSPLGVASYTTTELPEDLRSELPGVEELERSLECVGYKM